MAKGTKSLRGKLLLDGGGLAGSCFHRTVVLICQHNAEGAFGLVLNKPAEQSVGDVIRADLPLALAEQPLFNGGPVQPGALSFLHTDTFLPGASVMPNLNLDHSLESLIDLAEGFSPSQSIRVFSGYAGWAPGQLESELKREAWLTHPASINLVFHTPPDQLWRNILRKKGWQYRLFSESPEDLSWN